VQEWSRSVVREVALRYRDSPALQGVAIRLQGYAYASWQSFASLQWGYDDYTYSRFVTETNWPDSSAFHGATRHAQRHRDLTGHGLTQWVTWRTRVIGDFHQRLADELRTIRPDYLLYVNSYGAPYSEAETANVTRHLADSQRMGWLAQLRTTGVDPLRYTDASRMVFSDAIRYPAGAKLAGGYATPPGLALLALSRDSARITTVADASPTGVARASFFNDYFEADLEASLVDLAPQRKVGESPARFRLCATLNPTGSALLLRYLDALAAGNVVALTDGGMGYVLNQPQVLRPFLAEYKSLPVTAMRRVPGLPEELALWQSTDGTTFHVVNRSARTRSITLTFSAAQNIHRLATGQSLGSRSLAQTLEIPAYSMLAFGNRGARSRIVSAHTMEAQP
jgi:hypothetical protein